VKSEGQKFAFRLETVAVSGKSTKSSGTVNDLMLRLTRGSVDFLEDSFEGPLAVGEDSTLAGLAGNMRTEV
jgi:hypothetical protein